MASLFRTATKQAILEIIEENAHQGRFGLLLTDEGMDAITDRIVDLFEMTLNLRSHTQGMFSPAQPQPQPEETKTPSFSRNRNTFEHDSARDKTLSATPSLPSQQFLKLPRKRVELSDVEREKLRYPRS